MTQVMMKDLVTPVAVDEIRNVVRKCLENAALINYNKVNEMARNEGENGDERSHPSRMSLTFLYNNTA